ncbi:hypothetical protein EYF80_066582 [Liparis tanakae]|uniref:Uncharacterized protein n=1 Tax=Liparis tanakae TaxID=230148 RepID=A0A4Z2E3J0_9TELE|nr:hypothetical protein EYF80_066582 [Liparis tanakae]
MELGRAAPIDHQQAWEVALKWIGKKYRAGSREAVDRAAEDMREVGGKAPKNPAPSKKDGPGGGSRAFEGGTLPGSGGCGSDGGPAGKGGPDQ